MTSFVQQLHDQDLVLVVRLPQSAATSIPSPPAPRPRNVFDCPKYCQ